jgi:hypothetical protein
VIKAITEDPKNPDVLYAGAETGLFVSTDRGATWMRPKWNLPTVRVDEIVIHPRDNAMVLATHGPRDLGARSRRADPGIRRGEELDGEAVHAAAGVDVPPSGADRNYEFWGNQVFYGENPPQAAVISYFTKEQAERGEAEDQRADRP